MIILKLTTDKLQLASSAAALLDVHASLSDHTLSDDNIENDKQNTAFTTATTLDIVGPPASGDERNVKTLNIRNKSVAVATDATIIYDENGTDFELHKATINPGAALEYVEGVGWFPVTGVAALPTMLKALAADENGQNVATAQPWFPTNGAVSVAASTTYFIRGCLLLTRAAGSTSHTTGIGFGGTATLTNIVWWAQCGEGDVATLADSDMIVSQSAANLQVKAASTATTEVIKVTLDGILRVNAAGTFIPQFTYSAAPGGAPVVETNTWFRLDSIGAGSFASIGTWT